jgi:hypothetical protein
MKARMIPVARTATRVALLAALFAFGPAAAAQETPEPWHGFYVGGGGTYSNVSVEVGTGCYDCYYWWGDYPYYDEGDGDYSYSVHMGYRFNPWIAAELTYVDGGTIGWDEDYVFMPELGGYYRNEVDFSAKVPELSVLGILPFAQRWEVYARGGLAAWDATSDQKLTDLKTGEVIYRESDDDGLDFLFGIGIGVTFLESFHTRLEYQAVWIDGDALNVDSDTSLDTLMLDLQYRF